MVRAGSDSRLHCDDALVWFTSCDEHSAFTLAIAMFSLQLHYVVSYLTLNHWSRDEAIGAPNNTTSNTSTMNASNVDDAVESDYAWVTTLLYRHHKRMPT